MTTEAQTNSNRKNAQSSTGPRTPEGKAIASQNAVKHGFFAKNDVILGEDPAAYEEHRQDIYDEYVPLTPTESVLTQRIASLTWRLMRADRLQTTTINTLVTGHYADPPYKTRELLKYPSTTESHPGPALSVPELVLGSVIYNDFKYSKVLNRLAIYERRIENSLCKTIRLIQQVQKTRTKAAAAQEKRDWQYLRQEDEAERNRRDAEYRQKFQNEPNPRTAGVSPASQSPNARNEPNSQMLSEAKSRFIGEPNPDALPEVHVHTGMGGSLLRSAAEQRDDSPDTPKTKNEPNRTPIKPD